VDDKKLFHLSTKTIVNYITKNGQLTLSKPGNIFSTFHSLWYRLLWSNGGKDFTEQSETMGSILTKSNF